MVGSKRMGSTYEDVDGALVKWNLLSFTYKLLRSLAFMFLTYTSCPQINALKFTHTNLIHAFRFSLCLIIRTKRVPLSRRCTTRRVLLRTMRTVIGICGPHPNRYAPDSPTCLMLVYLLCVEFSFSNDCAFSWVILTNSFGMLQLIIS